MKNQLFNTIEPSKNLKVSILNTIKREETKRTIYKIAFSSALSLFSISIAVTYFINIVKDAYQSGLSEYLSLLLSDGASIMSYWQTYVMSVVESLPIVFITIVVASVWVFVWSVNSILETSRETRKFFYKVS